MSLILVPTIMPLMWKLMRLGNILQVKIRCRGEWSVAKLLDLLPIRHIYLRHLTLITKLIIWRNKLKTLITMSYWMTMRNQISQFTCIIKRINIISSIELMRWTDHNQRYVLVCVEMTSWSIKIWPSKQMYGALICRVETNIQTLNGAVIMKMNLKELLIQVCLANLLMEQLLDVY